MTTYKHVFFFFFKHPINVGSLVHLALAPPPLIPKASETNDYICVYSRLIDDLISAAGQEFAFRLGAIGTPLHFGKYFVRTLS